VSEGTVVSEELVVLLDDDGTAIGTAPKATVHTADTPLHRAFSCYVFDGDGRLLVTQRAAAKRTFPGVWTNTVCGHPAPGEDDESAITRRARDELGLAVCEVTVALPRFRYRAEAGGIVENEICPVYLARTTGEPARDPAEVDDHRWTTWAGFLAELAADGAGEVWSPWCRLQAVELDATGAVPRYLG
jgi:isopentenyl-diphosphate delta-isomerase